MIGKDHNDGMTNAELRKGMTVNGKTVASNRASRTGWVRRIVFTDGKRCNVYGHSPAGTGFNRAH